MGYAHNPENRNESWEEGKDKAEGDVPGEHSDVVSLHLARNTPRAITEPHAGARHRTAIGQALDAGKEANH